MRNDTWIWNYIQAEQNDHPVVVWSKSYCADSIRSQQLLQTNFPTIPLRIHNLNLVPDGIAIERVLTKWQRADAPTKTTSGVPTKPTVIPQIVVQNQTSYAGHEALLAAYHSGELERLLLHSSDQNENEKVQTENREEDDEEKKEDVDHDANDKHEKATGGCALLRTMIEHENNAHEIVVWGEGFANHHQDSESSSKNGTASQRAKDLLEHDEFVHKHVHVAFHDISEMPDAKGIRHELVLMTTSSSSAETTLTTTTAVPFVFVDGLHLGSTQELEEALQSGQLQGLLARQHPSQS